MTKPIFNSFEEFWPFYLGEHANPVNRRMHQAGTTAALTVFAAGVVLRRPRLMLAAPLFGYGPAWVGHFFVEKNKPASFGYPLWSFIGDFKMNALMWSGKLDAELDRLGIAFNDVSDMDSDIRDL